MFVDDLLDAQSTDLLALEAHDPRFAAGRRTLSAAA